MCEHIDAEDREKVEKEKCSNGILFCLLLCGDGVPMSGSMLWPSKQSGP